MIQLNDIPTNKEDRPIDPAPKIIKTEVLSNPFDDIVARVDERKLEKTKEDRKSQSKATKYVVAMVTYYCRAVLHVYADSLLIAPVIMR